MSRKIIFGLLGIVFLLALGFSSSPMVRAETDALTVQGVVHAIDLKTKHLTVKKANHTTITLKYNKDTIIERNGKVVLIKSIALQDSIRVRYKASLLALKFSATGPKTGKVSGMLSNAVKGSGMVTIGTTTVQTTAQTRISRNGKLVSLSQLTRQDKLVAHTSTTVLNAPATEPEAEDLIASGPEDDEVHGSITAISGSQVTVTPTNGSADVAVNVTGTTMIELDGSTAAIGNLAVGMQVEVHFNPATFDAFSIETDSVSNADDAHVTGTVAAVDLVAGSVTISPTVGANVTVTVDAATEMQVNDAVGTIQDIQVGMPIRAEFDLTTMVAKEINAGAGDENNEDTELEGTVSAVDENNGTVSISPDGGGADVTVNVVTETDIEVNGVNASIASIQVGMPARAEYDNSTMNAFEIHAGTDDGGGSDSEEADVQGTIASVDTINSTVTISPDGGGDDITLNVVDATEIEVNGDPGTLADFNNGDNIDAKYISATMEATEIRVEAP